MPTKYQNVRKQFWATEIYTEDCDIAKLNKCILTMHIDCALSPLHNRDIEKVEKSGLCDEIVIEHLKKFHWHLLVMFESAVGLASFKYLIDKHLRDCGIHAHGEEAISSGVGYARYLIHLDNPEKAQYNKDDILYYGQLDESILRLNKKNKIQESTITQSIVKDIIQNDITNLIDLIEFYYIYNPNLISYIQGKSAEFERYCRNNFYRSLQDKGRV